MEPGGAEHRGKAGLLMRLRPAQLQSVRTWLQRAVSGREGRAGRKGRAQIHAETAICRDG